jgi:DNA-binding response OmpR family regulator
LDDARRRPRVLVVDDDAGIRMMLQLALSSRGYLVDAIAGAAEGWLGRPDVVVLDARLSGQTGAAFLTEADLDPSVPIVLMTAAQDAEKLAVQLSAAAVIRKPFDLDDLFETVESLTGAADPGR